MGGTHLSVNSAGSDWPEAQHTQRVGRNAMRCDVPARCQPRFGTRKRVPYVNALCRRWAAQSFHSELLWIPGVVAGVQEGATLPHHPFYACSSYCMDLTVWTYARTDLAAQTCNCSQARHFRYTFPEVGGLALSRRRNRIRGDYRRRTPHVFPCSISSATAVGPRAPAGRLRYTRCPPSKEPWSIHAQWTDGRGRLGGSQASNGRSNPVTVEC